LNLVCFNGTDRTQTVQFSTSFDSLANGEFIDSSESFANAIYVGGKGQNDDRDIYEGESAIEGNSPSGLDRFESWDNQSSMTTESEYETEALSMLNQYGQTLTMSGNGLAKCPYEYEKEYFVGDKIKIAFSGKSANAQILSVTEHWAFGAYEINFSFGKPLPDLNAQLQLILKQIQKASNKTNSTDSVRWYTIPTDAEMPKADVTYDTIGFVGNIGSGVTFKLYLDDEKTGAKSYHVWFKQLSGNGKLTLTTGKSGAVNLEFGGGTYVAIISVDENGNIVNVAETPTDLIQAGNNAPLTSNGATALQPVDTVTSGNMHSVTSNAVAGYSAPKVRNKNQLAVFEVPSNWGIEVNEQQYPSTATATWQPMVNVNYEQDGKNSSLGFFQNNLTFVKNNAEPFYVVLCPLEGGKPIEIKHSILRKTTNNFGTFILTTEKPLYARCTNIADAMCIIGSNSAIINWVKVCNYDFTPLANTDVELDLYYI
jgi:hypothetical protein